jgi:hypothetical protein
MNDSTPSVRAILRSSAPDSFRIFRARIWVYGLLSCCASTLIVLLCPIAHVQPALADGLFKASSINVLTVLWIVYTGIFSLSIVDAIQSVEPTFRLTVKTFIMSNLIGIILVVISQIGSYFSLLPDLHIPDKLALHIHLRLIGQIASYVLGPPCLYFSVRLYLSDLAYLLGSIKPFHTSWQLTKNHFWKTSYIYSAILIALFLSLCATMIVTFLLVICSHAILHRLPADAAANVAAIVEFLVIFLTTIALCWAAVFEQLTKIRWLTGLKQFHGDTEACP